MEQESDAQMSCALLTFKSATLGGWLTAQEVIGLSYLLLLSRLGIHVSNEPLSRPSQTQEQGSLWKDVWL